MTTKETVQAIVLAGGEAQRLRPHTNDRPKSMLEVGNKPIIDHQIDQLKRAGIEHVVIACSYMREVLIAHVGSGERYGISASFSVEETLLGRGGAIKKAMKELKGEWQDVVVTNGDNLWRVNMPELITQHREKNAIATIVVVPLKSPYGIVEFNEKGEILRFIEKPNLPHWINAGIYIFNREIEPLLPNIGDHETETFLKLPPKRFLVYRSTDYWRAVDTEKDLTEARKEHIIFQDPSILSEKATKDELTRIC